MHSFRALSALLHTNMSAWHRSLFRYVKQVHKNTDLTNEYIHVIVDNTKNDLEGKHDYGRNRSDTRGGSKKAPYLTSDGNSLSEDKGDSWWIQSCRSMASRRTRPGQVHQGAKREDTAAREVIPQNDTDPLTLWRVRSGP